MSLGCLCILEFQLFIQHFVFFPAVDGIVARQLNQTSAFGAWVLSSYCITIIEGLRANAKQQYWNFKQSQGFGLLLVVPGICFDNDEHSWEYLELYLSLLYIIKEP